MGTKWLKGEPELRNGNKVAERRTGVTKSELISTKQLKVPHLLIRTTHIAWICQTANIKTGIL